VAVLPRELGVPERSLTASGYLVANRQITLSSKAQGRIVEMPVDENQQVKAGDLIARVEDREQRAALRLAEAEFKDSRRERNRVAMLRKGGTSSQAELDRAETAYQVSEARLALAQVALDNTVLRAPIDGTVIRKLRDAGEFLTIGVSADGAPGTSVATLADLSAIDVALEISESEIRRVLPGAVALVAPEALPDRRFLADVTEVAAMANRQKGVVPVTVRIREPVAALLPDMTVRVSFLEGEPEGEIEVLPSLPTTAVVERDGKSVVFQVEEDLATAVVVKTKAIDDDHMAILSGVEDGDFIVEAPSSGLDSGDAIAIAKP